MNALLVDQMAMYSAYHRDARNRATHFLGVPAIAFSILIPMAWVRLDAGDVSLSLAMAFTLAVLVFYLWMDRALAFATTAVYLPILLVAEWVGAQSLAFGGIVFAVFFIGGWIVQLIGHAFEGRKPALLDNLAQIFIAPVFLTAEVLIAVGLKHDLHAAVEARMPAYLPAAPDNGSAGVSAA